MSKSKPFILEMNKEEANQLSAVLWIEAEYYKEKRAGEIGANWFYREKESMWRMLFNRIHKAEAHDDNT